MKHGKLYEVRVSAESGDATVSSEGSAIVKLPVPVFSRSSVLQQAIANDDTDLLTRITLPVGVLESWMDGLDLLNVAARAQQTGRTSTGPSLTTGHEQLLKTLKVFPDLTCVTSLRCHVECNQLT